MKIHSAFKKTITKRITVITLAFVVVFFGITGVYLVNRKDTANAVSATDFKDGNIISDSVFYNKDAMSAAQIQSFLNSLIPSCDTWHVGTFRNADGSVVGAPYVCLNNYYENPNTGETSFEKGGGAFAGGISAAQIIYNAAQDYGINPQVLLVMLKKESLGPLTSDNWPVKWQYRYAMGYACPDSGPNNSANCNDKQAGFYKQVNLAAWQFKYYKDHPNDYRYALGWNDIQYSPDVTCGTKHVYIENIATLSLYIYTPYVPNAAALADYPGTADCGAYGNRNFFMFFSQWFGSTGYSINGAIKEHYDAINAASTLGQPIANEIKASNDSWFQQFQNGYIIGSGATGYWESKGGIRDYWAKIGYQNGKMGFPISDENYDGKGWWQGYQNGAIIGTANTGFWESSGAIRRRWAQLGYQSGALGYPTSQEFWGGNAWWQSYQNGYIIGSGATGYWESKGGIRDYWAKIGYQNGKMGFPTGPEQYNNATNTWSQKYQNGTIYCNSSSAWSENN